MAITAGMVKELREMTGAGMMDCKKALAATDGDMDKAVEFLKRKRSCNSSEKSWTYLQQKGLCQTLVSADEKHAVVVEVNAETDFVAKNDVFQGYVAQVAEAAMETETTTTEDFLASPWKFDTTKNCKRSFSSTDRCYW